MGVKGGAAVAAMGSAQVHLNAEFAAHQHVHRDGQQHGGSRASDSRKREAGALGQDRRKHT